jgi:hypothetical protein
LIDDRLLDALLERSRDEAGGLRLTGEGSMLGELVKAVLERALEAELTAHLGRRRTRNPTWGLFDVLAGLRGVDDHAVADVHGHMAPPGRSRPEGRCGGRQLRHHGCWAARSSWPGPAGLTQTRPVVSTDLIGRQHGGHRGRLDGGRALGLAAQRAPTCWYWT